MGLARIAIAALAVTLALGLLILGGVSLWGALTKDSGPANAASAAPSVGASGSVPAARQSTSTASAPGSNTVVLQCLAPQCQVYVAGPGPTDVQFHGNLTQNEKRIFSDTRLTVQVYDAGSVAVTINGHLQPRGKRGQVRTYRVPAQQ